MSAAAPSTYRRLAKYAASQWRSLVCILAATVLVSFTAALEPLPLKLLVDHALGHAPVPAWLESALRAVSLSPASGLLVLTAALASLLVFALTSALDAALTWLWASAGQRMVVDLTTDLFSRLQRLSLQFHRTRPLGDSLSRLTTDSWCVYSLTSTLMVAPLQETVTLASVGLVAWRLDPSLAILCLSMAPLLGGSSWWFGRRLRLRAKEGRVAQAAVVSFVQQTLSAMPLVQAFHTARRNRRRFAALGEKAVGITQRSALLTSSYGMVNGAIVTLGTAVVLFGGGLRVMSGTLALGTLLVFLAYTRTLQRSVAGLLKIYGSLKPLEASMDRVVELLSSSEAVPEAPDAVPLTQGETDGHIRFEDVSFGYQPGRPVLQDITLEVGPGETVALVGPTGAGKSTLTSMIPRFHDPWSGRILLDGTDLRKLRLRSLRGEIAMVLQDSLLLPVSVAENIAYGRPEATREEIVAAAVAANAHRFIQDLPQGYDTVLGEDGATLSGGERQRLSVARAMLRDARLVILDEPTSALDPASEAALLEGMERLMAQRTTIVIAHRFSTVRRADRIVVLDQGRVVETGTHEELLEMRGLYHRCWTLQSFEGREDVA